MAPSDEGEWQVATGKGSHRHGKNGSHKHKPGAHAASRPPQDEGPPSAEKLARCCSSVRAATDALERSAFYAGLLSQLRAAPPPPAWAATAPLGSASHGLLSGLTGLVVYGLGSLQQPGGAHIRHQLALAGLLRALLAPGAPAEAFDPVFTPLDRAVLLEMGFQVVARDEGGRRVARRPTLFYLPHCEAGLTDALLEVNVAAGTLSNVAVLGNRFSGYAQRFSSAASGGGSSRSSSEAAAGRGSERRFGSRGGALHPEQRGAAAADGGAGPSGASGAVLPRPAALLELCAAGAVREATVDEAAYPVLSAFNDTALHTFQPDWAVRLAGGVT